MTRIRGALFDKDGTLLDFTATWRGLVEGMVADLAGGDAGLALALGDAIGFDGRTGAFLPGSPVVSGGTDEVAELLGRLLPRMSVEEIERDANRRAAAVGAGDCGGLQAPAGMGAALARLSAEKIALGVATHDSESVARAQVRQLGFAPHFGFYAGYDSGHGMKPGPGMVNAFCAATGLAPGDVVMVGDSVHDLGAGRAAGCAAAVAVLTGPATEAELAPLADVVLESAADLPDFLARRFPA